MFFEIFMFIYFLILFRHSLPRLNTGSLYSVSSEESSIKSISSPPDFSGMTPPNHTVDGVKCLRNELNVRNLTFDASLIHIQLFIFSSILLILQIFLII